MSSVEYGHIFLATGNIKLLNQCKRFCVPRSVGHFIKINRRYFFQRDGWEIPEDAYEKALENLKIKEQIQLERQQNQPKVFRIIPILRSLYKANQNAKMCIKAATSTNAYSRKDYYLRKAINLAREITLPWFYWGIGLDESTPGYEIVIYFQFGDDPQNQVSFHTDQAPDCPIFQKEWNRYHPSKFPLSIPQIRKIARDLNWTKAKLLELDALNIFDDRICENYNNTVNFLRENRQENRRLLREEREMFGYEDFEDEDEDEEYADYHHRNYNRKNFERNFHFQF